MSEFFAQEGSELARVLGERLESPPYGALFPELVEQEKERNSNKKTKENKTARLQRIAKGMLPVDREADEADTSQDNPDFPAGYTYFGQFLAHDLTFMGRPAGEGLVVQGDVANRRTPLFDLDCLYGGAPWVAPWLYQRGWPSQFVIGGRRSYLLREAARPAPTDDDLPRNQQGMAMIADPRNDVNVMVAQLHLALMKAHNRLAKKWVDGGCSHEEAFEEARKELRWHYQWVILHDYLPRILDAASQDWVRSAMTAKADGHRIRTRFFNPWRGPFVPYELVAAVFRFGHSTVRPGYMLNEVTRKPVRLTPRTSWTQCNARQHLFGFQHLPSHWSIDWRFFLEVPEDVYATPVDPEIARSLPQPARLIDPRLTWHLGNLPPQVRMHGENASLPEMTLLRGLALNLPSGQAIAEEMRKEMSGLTVLEKLDEEETPLWYYVLDEARRQEDGRRLGPVASTILAEVFVGMMDIDPGSFLHVAPKWKPDEIGHQKGRCTLADLLTFG